MLSHPKMFVIFFEVFVGDLVHLLIFPIQGQILSWATKCVSKQITGLPMVNLPGDVTAKNTTIASESLSGEITGKTYEAKKYTPEQTITILREVDAGKVVFLAVTSQALEARFRIPSLCGFI